MSTWGASKKRSSSGAKRSTPKTGAAKRSATSSGASSRGATGRSSGSKGTAKASTRASGNVRDLTPPAGSSSRRDQATAELRDAVGGREHEFVGLGMIGVAVLLGLAVYMNLAGPLGRGVETIAGWIFGLGRYAVPVVLVAAGVSFVRKGRSAGPFQLVVGWSMMSLAVLGLLQVARGSSGFSDASDGIEEAGGWIGALVGIPSEALLATAGAAVMLVLAFAGGALLVTRTSIRTFAQQTGGFLAAVGAPLGRAAKSGISNISTLSSDREADAAARIASGEPAVMGEASSLSPGLYDFAAEGDDLGGELPPPKPRRTREAQVRHRQPAVGVTRR